MFTTLKVLKDFKRGLLPLIKTLKVGQVFFIRACKVDKCLAVSSV
jgi:hypothetical protein